MSVLAAGDDTGVACQSEQEAQLVEQATRPVERAITAAGVSSFHEREAEVERRILETAADAELVAAGETIDLRQEPAIDVVGFLHGR